ncbi:MAG TPA: contact-dependent growth inhibition system immunity protein [Gemmatimonadaceae bacterium]|jgi:hypothetical protein|nr:contact-dependent growth inhibition system immunity protein [Gemmatimonadaceae bacterium]
MANARHLLVSLVDGTCTASEVQRALRTLNTDPLARVHAFRGDLLRALMEVPNAFWARYPALYNEYREVVRAGALARRDLPKEARDEFWSPLQLSD